MASSARIIELNVNKNHIIYGSNKRLLVSYAFIMYVVNKFDIYFSFVAQ